ncbi:MAG: lytic transglycosylase domain-containing protein [Asticcacaulis sp.]
MTAFPATAQVLSVGDDGTATLQCTAYQNPHRRAESYAASPSIPPAYAAMIEAAAQRYEIAPALLDALARQESNYNPNARSPKGAIGIMQLMPATARVLHLNPNDPAQNIMGGAIVLRQALNAFNGQIDLALAAYNAGQGAVVKYGGIPPYAETRAYVRQNLDKLARLSDSRHNDTSESAMTDPAAQSYIQTCAAG